MYSYNKFVKNISVNIYHPAFALYPQKTLEHVNLELMNKYLPKIK